MKNGVTLYFLEQKNIRGYIIVYVLAALVLSCFSVFYLSSGFLFWLMKVVQLLSFASLGLLHTTMIERGLPFLEDKFTSRLSFSALLAALICIVLFAFYFFTNSSTLFMAFASSCAFFMPFTLRQFWNQYKKLPESRSIVWYGFNDELDSPDIVYLSSIPVTFRLEINPDEKTVLSFSIKAPLQMELSRLFNLFVLAAEKNYNIHIEPVDENNRFYGWQFFAEYLKGLLKLQLDPEVIVGDNRAIKPDTVIFVKRVKATGTQALPSRKELKS
ncbi:MAG: hypothetical protein INR73_01195 [Williamsia sp.]|nr:hypothetical protein [Williamsia sp.]